MPADSLTRMPLVRIQLVTPMPCGIYSCRQLAQMALAEPDPAYPGLWSILPLCPKCLAREAGDRLVADADEIADTCAAQREQIEKVTPFVPGSRKSRRMASAGQAKTR